MCVYISIQVYAYIFTYIHGCLFVCCRTSASETGIPNARSATPNSFLARVPDLSRSNLLKTVARDDWNATRFCASEVNSDKLNVPLPTEEQERLRRRIHQGYLRDLVLRYFLTLR